MTELAMTPSMLVELLRKGLRVGIPPTALSNMLDVPPDVVKNLAHVVRREQYGTAEMTEFLSNLTWEALGHQLRTIKFGSPELSQKAASVVMGKALATSVRQTPEEVMRAREELIAAIGQERLIEIEGVRVEEASAFVAMDEPSDDQRQAGEAVTSG